MIVLTCCMLQTMPQWFIKGVTVNVTISHVLRPSVLSFAWTPPPIEGFEASAPLVALRRSKSPADARPGRPRAHRRAP